MVNLYEYVNYREYLQTYFAHSKERDSKFSHRFLARRLGLLSPNFMMLVMQGKRNITRSLTSRISDALKHNDKEADYFENMVGFAQAKTATEKDRYFGRLQQLRRYCQVEKIPEDQYEYYSKWYNIPVRELVTYADFQGNYKWLAKKVLPSITEAQARRSVELLLKLGLIKRNGKGYERTSRVISTGDEVSSLAVVNYHRQMAALAGAALDAISREERNISACTVNISLKGLREIEKAVSDCRKKILTIAEADSPANRVYQVNFQVFPVSTKEKGGKKMNMKMKLRIFLFAFLPLALFGACTNNNNIVDGGTETGNARGQLVRADGTPAAGAKVFFIPVDHNPSGSSKILANLDSVTADNQGYFGATLDSGTYNMFAAQDTLSAYVDSIGIHQDTVTLPTDTLKPSGSIRGVSFMPGQDEANQVRVTIYAPGTNLYTKPDIGGAFSFGNVPEGTYRLIFDPTLDVYGVKVITVNVISGQTADLDTVIIYGQNLTGMPIPDAGNDTTVSINDTVRLHGSAKDSLGQIVKMEWGLAGTGAFATTATGDTAFVAPDTPAVVRYVLRVEDNDGNVLTDTVVVNVIQDPPIANAGPDTTVSINDTLVVYGSGTDVYGHIVKYRFDVGGDGTYEDSSTSSGVGRFMGPADTGSYKVVLQVQDDDGNTANDTMLLHVVEPTITVIGHGDTAVKNGETVFIAATATVNYGTIAKYEWDFGNTGQFVKVSNGDTSFVPPSGVGFNWQCVVRATDSDGFAALDTITISVLTGWRQVTAAAAFPPRQLHAAVVFQNKMWVIAGGGIPEGYTDMWSSADGLTWTEILPVGPYPPTSLRYGSLVYGSTLWLFNTGSEGTWHTQDGIHWTGGTSVSNVSHNRLVVYNDTMWTFNGGQYSVQWSTTGYGWTGVISMTPGIEGQGGCGFAVHRNKMWIVGGYGYYPCDLPFYLCNDKKWQNDCWYSADGASWTLASDSIAIGPREQHALFSLGDKLWVIGGKDAAGNSMNSVWFSADGRRWAELAFPSSYPPRSGTTYLVFENKVWVIGGISDTNLNDVWCLE